MIIIIITTTTHTAAAAGRRRRRRRRSDAQKKQRLSVGVWVCVASSCLQQPMGRRAPTMNGPRTRPSWLICFTHYAPLAQSLLLVPRAVDERERRTTTTKMPKR
jgi:hypothetical protein